MRKRLIPAVLLLLPLYALASCDDDSAAGPGFDFDAGNVDSSSRPADAAPLPLPEAGLDAGPLPVVVTVTDGKTPEPGIVVVYGDATGAVIATETTNAAGVASHVVPSGSQVTVVMGTLHAPRLVTITEVEPGDLLSALDARYDDSPNATVTVASVPSDRPANTLFEVAIGQCGSQRVALPPTSVSVSNVCHRGGVFPLLVTAHDSEIGQEEAFTFKKDNSFPLQDGGGATVTANPTAAWSTSYTNNAITVTNPPAEQSGRLYFNEVANGVALWNESFFNSGVETQVRTFPGRSGYADFVQSEAQIVDYNEEMSVSAIATRSAPAPDAGTSFDLAQLLPLLTGATIDQTSKARPTVSWTSAGSLSAADGAFVHLRWNAVIDAGSVSGTWTFVTSPTHTSVKAPALPASVSAFAPPEEAANFANPPVVTVVEGTFIANYAELRKVSAALPAETALSWSSGDTGGIVPPLPVPGTLRATAYTRSND